MTSPGVLSDAGHVTGGELFLSYGRDFWGIQQKWVEEIQENEDERKQDFEVIAHAMLVYVH